MTPAKFLLIFLLSLTCLVSLGLAQDNIPCDDNNRPENSECFGDDTVSQPTCAYYTTNCPFDVCGRDVANGCDACSDPNVLYYRNQVCPADIVVQSCSEGICNPEADPDQERVFEPVCGFRRDCNGGDCSTTFDNVCRACQNSNYPWYQSGVCQDDRRSCDDRDSCFRASKTQPVCAFFDTADGGVDQHTTVANARSACEDPAVDYYINRECGPNRDDSTYCLPNVRPDICTREYNPVCGFYLDDEQVLRHKIMSNPCVACADETIIYHQPGPCVFKCNRSPFIIFECDGTYIEPVCGSYEENGETRRISLKNSCIGCYNIPTKIDTYVDGLCPGDEGIRCENDAGGFLVGRISPVCGVFSEGCNSDTCRQSYAESVAACSDSNVILFQPGLCPGDEGISCSPYRTRPEDEDDFISNLVYQNVCGYSEEGGSEYADQFEACANDDVEYFTEGPCA